MDNLDIYNRVRSVPSAAKKSFNNGKFSGTDVNPMWRIKTLTETFGPVGLGWYVEVTEMRQEALGDEIMAVCNINLYVKYGGEWSLPIFGTGGNMLRSSTKKGLVNSDEGYKMAYTDALSVACKALGVAADVYFEKDVTKYTQYEQQSPQTPPQVNAEPPRATPEMATAAQIKWLNDNCDAAQLDSMKAKYGLKFERLTKEGALKLVKRVEELKNDGKSV